MIDTGISQKAFGFGIWTVVFVMMFLWIGVLISPIFIPHIRKYVEVKYSNFVYKDKLIAEELSFLIPAMWIVFILGWAITLIVLPVVL